MIDNFQGFLKIQKDINPNSKIFLGGTTNGWDWRADIIPILEREGLSFFNPLVDDWTEEDRLIEIKERDEVCDIHLYVITSDMIGCYSIAEIMESAFLMEGKQTYTVFIPGDVEGHISKSFLATHLLIAGRGAWSALLINNDELVSFIENTFIPAIK
jgi:hypothetical protein